MSPMSRRGMIKGSAASALGGALLASSPSAETSAPAAIAPKGRRFAVKYGMVRTKGTMEDKFRMLKNLGFDGVELDSPANYDAAQVQAASKATGLPVHGVVNSTHWRIRLSDPKEEQREKGLKNLLGAIQDAKDFGGSSVLLVPGAVRNDHSENPDQVWERSIAAIHRALPLAAELGIHILIENVWNGFCYVHGGHEWQGAERFAAYIDAIASPWVGMYHDLGNHRKYGHVEDWVRCLGRRIVKVDVKGWGKKDGFCKIGDGDIDWPKVSEALSEVGFHGWCTAEVSGGGEARLADIKKRMDAVLRS